MRIAHMVDTLEIGGAQKLLVSFARAIQERDINLTVINLWEGGNQLYYDELRDLGAKVDVFVSGYLLEVKRIRHLVDYVRREKFDVIHTHLSSANTIGAIVGRITLTPVVSTLHSVGIDSRNRYSYRHFLETLALRYGTKLVIAVGRTVAEAHQKRLDNNNIMVIPNAVETFQPLKKSKITSIRSEFIVNPPHPIIISVGRLSSPKGYSDLIDAFAILWKKYKDLTLLIVGEGELLEELKSKIKILGLEKNILLLGERHDINALLSISDIFVSSSIREGLPLAILEAMAAGLPVVATSVGDVPNVVIDGTGIVVPPHKPLILAGAISQLLDNPEKRATFGSTGKARIKQEYNLKKWSDQLFWTYMQVAS